MIDLKEHKERMAARTVERKRELQTRVSMLDQAAVKAELLIGDPKWDTFLTYLQAMIDQTTGQRDRFMALLADPVSVEMTQIMQAKIGVVRCEERITTVNAIMVFPKQIIEQAEAAKPEPPVADEAS